MACGPPSPSEHGRVRHQLLPRGHGRTTAAASTPTGNAPSPRRACRSSTSRTANSAPCTSEATNTPMQALGYERPRLRGAARHLAQRMIREGASRGGPACATDSGWPSPPIREPISGNLIGGLSDYQDPLRRALEDARALPWHPASDYDTNIPEAELGLHRPTRHAQPRPIR